METEAITLEELTETLKELETKDPTKKNIYIIGEVNENTTSEVVRELIDINWEKENIKEFNIYISSMGGFLSDCFAIIDLTLQLKKDRNIIINTYGLGEVASAGFFLFLLGDTRTLYPSCRVFVHSHITVGDEKTFVERVKADKTEEKELYNNYVDYMANQLGVSTTKAKNLLKKNKWLTKKEIRDYNIIKESSCQVN